MVAGTHGNDLSMWNAIDGTLIVKLTGHTGPVGAIFRVDRLNYWSVYKKVGKKNCIFTILFIFIFDLFKVLFLF